jgi:RNA polymerase sigma-70 factor, ECF subfamily
MEPTATLLERAPDPVSAAWVRDLTADGARHEDAVRRLHALLLRACRAELGRRAFRARLTGQDVDDLAVQAAGDATLAVLGKLDRFRGESRFTTWAYAFAVFEVSAVLGARWRRAHERVEVTPEQWDAMPDRLAAGPEELAQARELVRLLRTAVDHDLTPRQRSVFLAVVVQGVPLDALVHELGTTRGAVYKTVFEARRKLRQALVAHGYRVPPPGLLDHRPSEV